MSRATLAVVLFLAGCGSTAACLVEGEVHCGTACISICSQGEWRQVMCLHCQQQMLMVGTVNQCVTKVECS